MTIGKACIKIAFKVPHLKKRRKINHCTRKFLLNAGHKAKSSTANVTVANECKVVCNLEARHTDANSPAFNDKTPETLKMCEM